MKIKMLQREAYRAPGEAHWIACQTGETCDVPDAIARGWIVAGVAEPAEPRAEEKPRSSRKEKESS